MPNCAHIWDAIGYDAYMRPMLHCHKCREMRPTPQITAQDWHKRGRVFEIAQNHNAAGNCYVKALEIDPMHVGSNTDLGNCLMRNIRYDAAITCFTKAIEADSACFQAHAGLGGVYAAKQEYGPAERAFHRAIALQSTCWQAHAGLAQLYQDTHRPEDALPEWETALHLDEFNERLINGKVLALERLSRYTEALLFVDDKLFDKSNYRLVRAQLLANMGRIGEAMEEYRLAPDTIDDRERTYDFNFAFAMHFFDETTPAEIFEQHRRTGVEMEKGILRFKHHGGDPEKKLRIGYVSVDFKRHSVAYFLAPVFECRDYENFEIYCYSGVVHPDAVTARFKAMSDGWTAIWAMNEDDVAELIMKDKIDILVDLSGRTAGQRLSVFARKPAPVQATWLGYPDTTGLTSIDWRIVDAICDPPGESDTLNTEKLWRLPHGMHCFEAPRDSPDVAPPPCLKNGYVTFGSFGSYAKISGTCLRLWADVLNSVPDSRLLLKTSAFTDAAVSAEFLEKIGKMGVSADRVTLRGRIKNLRDHLALYGEVDIALDTFPYNGTATTCEALWMGVPVVSVDGDRHCARVGHSLLSSAHIEYGVAHEGFSMHIHSCNLAGQRGRLHELGMKTLAALRPKQRDLMLNSPLMDAPGFTRDLEDAYRGMWRAYCKGEKHEDS